MGELYLDLVGTCVAKNHTTGEECEFTCIQRGWKNKNAFRVEGVIRDSEGVERYDFEGFWNEYFEMKNWDTGEVTRLWEINPRLEMWDHLYHLSLFGIQLNYLDDHLASLLPPTDSRFRQDQRALENGDLKAAALEKASIE